MDTTTSGAIVVGVTGPGQETSALRFAAACATRDSAPVVLVHAFRSARPAAPPSVLMTDADAAEVAERVVAEVRAELEQIAGGAVEVHAVVRPGAPARALVELGRGARLVVVQHRTSHGLGRLFVGSTVNGTAAHCACPVVSVPTGWVPEETPGEVVIGVDEGGLPRQVMEAGFAWAAATGAPVRVVHAWRLDAAYDDIITSRVAATWRDEQRTALEAAVADLREAHPTVPVVVEVRHMWPTDVLVDDSQNATLVVVGRRHPHRWVGEHLGSLARTVLRESKSPVMVVPVPVSPDVPEG